jgi:hypothetical protein
MKVYDFNGNKMASWNKLPTRGNYPQKFLETRQLIYTPILNQGIFLGDLQEITSDTYSYPQDEFTHGMLNSHLADDPSDGLIFISGVNESHNDYEMGMNISRSIFIFDVNAKKFVKNIKVASGENSGKYFAPKLSILPKKNFLMLQFPYKIEIYNYEL